MNYKLLIQFDGTDFHGWQIQGKERTVQADLQRVLSGLNDAEVKVFGSGRTDAGVHAEGFVANVHLQKEFAPERLCTAINGNLRHDVRVLKAEIAVEDFHARFSAKGKTYLYRVVNLPVMPPFWLRYAHRESRFLDVEKMHEAAQHFVGTHDFTAFSSAKSDGENKVRTITEISVKNSVSDFANTPIIEFRITGNGFLRYMVRSIVGTLLEVGRGAKDSATIQTAIESGNRKLAGKTAEAKGLTLLKVYYE